MRGLIRSRTLPSALACVTAVGLALAVGRTVRAAGDICSDPNARPVSVLSQLDIDGDGVADVAPDSDCDGMPDNWEVGGAEGPSQNPEFRGDRYVSFPAPKPIGPGTPPVFIFSRQAVQTSAQLWDTDGDGLSDFIEVFGLKYIDDNGNQRLDFLFSDLNANDAWDGIDPFVDLNGNRQFDAGEPYYDLNGDARWTGLPGGGDEPIDPRSEWLDINTDGLPSVGERPLPNWFANVGTTAGTVDYVLLHTDSDGMPDTAYEQTGAATTPTFVRRAGLVDRTGDGIPDALDTGATVSQIRVFDWDGFLFTNPALADTDLDGTNDRDDRDPLINPATFGVPISRGFVRVGTGTDQDLDNDGLGNGSDFGNDYRFFPQTNGQRYRGGVDNPEDIADLMELFRPDRVFTDAEHSTRCSTPTLPESLVDDLLGVDWNGDGLFQISDFSAFHSGLNAALVLQTRTLFHNQQTSPACSSAVLPIQYENFEKYFKVGDRNLFVDDASITVICGAETAVVESGSCVSPTSFNDATRHLGWQEFLLPAGASQPFLPDVRVWAILYAWRMPGFDIDGNGYVGSPENNFQNDQTHPYLASTGGGSGTNRLDGRIDVDTSVCGNIGIAAMATLTACLLAMRFVPWRRRVE